MNSISGIYEIVNNENGKIYIGSAENLDKRKRNHFSQLSRGVHHSVYLQNAYNKYGVDRFEFCIVEYCPVDKLLEREQYYIDTLLPEYNISRKAGSPLGIKRSDETKRKLSEIVKLAMTPDRRKRIGEMSKGRIVSEETKEKMRASSPHHHQNKGYKHTESAVKKISEALHNRVIKDSTREKISVSKKGKPFSEEHKRNLSISHTGKKLSDEQKRNMSKAQKNKIMSEDAKAKIANSIREWWRKRKENKT